MFYNTTSEVNPQLSLFKERAIKQEHLILNHFKRNPESKYLREDVEKVFSKYPPQSIVRSLNSLMNEGKISKLNEFRIGKYGIKCHLYQLA